MLLDQPLSIKFLPNIRRKKISYLIPLNASNCCWTPVYKQNCLTSWMYSSAFSIVSIWWKERLTSVLSIDGSSPSLQGNFKRASTTFSLIPNDSITRRRDVSRSSGKGNLNVYFEAFGSEIGHGNAFRSPAIVIQEFDPSPPLPLHPVTPFFLKLPWYDWVMIRDSFSSNLWGNRRTFSPPVWVRSTSLKP